MHYSIWHIISSPILHIQFGLKLINERWRAMKPGAYCGLVILTILLMDALLCFNYQTSGQMHANLIPSPNKQINKINGRMAIYQRQESKEGKKPAQLHRINRTSFTDVVSYLSQKNHTEKKEYLPVIESSCLPTFLKNSAASWIGRASSSRYFTSMLQ